MTSDPSLSTPPSDQLTSTIHRVGVIGGGQLAWMMAEPAKHLKLNLVVQTPHLADPAAAVAANVVQAVIGDAAATAQLAQQCDVITFENEFVDLAALGQLAAKGVIFRPRLEALSPLLDKYTQRCYLRDIGLPVPQFRLLEVDPQTDLPTRLDTITFPIVLKARRHGYDGQGTFIVKDRAMLEAVWQKLAYQPVLLEEFVPFQQELAVIAARSTDGQIATYPVVETHQVGQVCRWVIAPAQIRPAVAAAAVAIAHTLLEQLQAVGVFGIELFLTSDDQVLVNEIAPRTHNSGHFSMDACPTSQFEQHLRAVSQLPLGATALLSQGAVMVNLLGYEQSTADYQNKRHQLAQIPQAHVHWYGKTESRPGRKLGHVTILLNGVPEAELRSQAIAAAEQVEDIWYGDDGTE